MIRDELITKKDMYKIYEEEFNKLWYNGAQKQTLNWIKKNLPIDGGLIKCDPYRLLYVKNKNDEYSCTISTMSTNSSDTYNTPKNTEYELNYYNRNYYFYFLKSKLWNEGINLMVDDFGNFYMSVRYKEDKYNDMFIIVGELKHINNISLIDVANFANMPVDKVYEKFVKLDEKRNNAITDVKKNNTSNNVSKSKNKKVRSHKKPIPSQNIINFDNDGDEIIKELKQNEEKEVLKEF